MYKPFPVMAGKNGIVLPTLCLTTPGPLGPPFLDATLRRGLQQDPAVDNVVEVLLPASRGPWSICASF